MRAIDWKFSKVVILTDSACNVAALKRPGTVYRPFFQHRLGEIHDNLGEMCKLSDSVEPVLHLPGEHNAADVITRGEVHLDQLSGGSIWATGPRFLKGSFYEWPVDVDPRGEVPSEEVKVVNIADAIPSLAEKLQSFFQCLNALKSYRHNG